MSKTRHSVPCALMIAAVLAVGELAAAARPAAAQAAPPPAPRASTVPTVRRETTYFEFQVDVPVWPAQGSSHPLYPPELKAAGVEGEALVQFVVDTLGHADTLTFRVLKTDHGAFAAAVKLAVPSMTYLPAERQGRKVRQLVQQPFVFAIAKTYLPTPPQKP